MSLLKEYSVKEDPRFKQTRKEALRILVLVIIETIWVFGFAYWGTKTDPSEYSYILGFPAWYFWAFLGAGVLVPIVSIILGLLIKDCELTDEVTTDENKDK